MCLDVVYQNHNIPYKGKAFKVFCIYSRNLRYLMGPYYFFPAPTEDGWYIDTSSKKLENKYLTGFHAFTNRKDAADYLRVERQINRHSSDRYFMEEIEYEDPTAVGKWGIRECIVVRKFRILSNGDSVPKPHTPSVMLKWLKKKLCSKHKFIELKPGDHIPTCKYRVIIQQKYDPHKITRVTD